MSFTVSSASTLSINLLQGASPTMGAIKSMRSAFLKTPPQPEVFQSTHIWHGQHSSIRSATACRTG